MVWNNWIQILEMYNPTGRGGGSWKFKLPNFTFNVLHNKKSQQRRG